ncbi:MAG: hypothetical protein JOZ53_23305 [Planctomycetaceae bacterium]|nr:hypothetical protein [Planctomycetaceae bacterium]
MSPPRRLVAILAADATGFLRLMGVDEGGTPERLKAMDASGRRDWGNASRQEVVRSQQPGQLRGPFPSLFHLPGISKREGFGERLIERGSLGGAQTYRPWTTGGTSAGWPAELIRMLVVQHFSRGQISTVSCRAGSHPGEVLRLGFEPPITFRQ